MAYPRTTLAVLTLLQLSRAEISDKQPDSWYSANVISDGFQPKPISEIFSTEPSFSSTNPIIVAPKSNAIPDEILLLSTLKPPIRKLTNTASTSGAFSKVSMLLLTGSTPFPPTVQQQPTSQSAPEFPPQTQSPPQRQLQPQQPQIQTQLQTIPQQQPEPQVQPLPQQQTEPQIQPLPQEQTQPPLLETQPIEVEVPSEPQQTTQPEPTPAELQTTQPQSQQTQSQQIGFELVPLQAPTQPELVPQAQQLPQFITQQPNLTETSTTSPQSNYFLIYQQAPQSIQGYPQQNQQQSVSVPPLPQTVLTRQQIVTTPPQPNLIISPQQIRPYPPGPIVQSMPTTRVTTAPNRTTPSGRINDNLDPKNIQPLVTTPIPGASPLVPPYSGVFPIKIRVVAPSGSITNVRINPTSTTRRPTTTRTRKTNRPKKNSYNMCIDACKGRRDPICGAPLSANPVNPNTLKGFPSVCHMACHNSFRRQPYEKLVDGRCGRLRTRIRPVDSNSKLKRDELNKAQYFIDNTGPNTVVEFSGALNLPQ